MVEFRVDHGVVQAVELLEIPLPNEFGRGADRDVLIHYSFDFFRPSGRVERACMPAGSRSCFRVWIKELRGDQTICQNMSAHVCTICREIYAPQTKILEA